MKLFTSKLLIAVLITVSTGLISSPQTLAQTNPIPGGTTNAGGLVGQTVYQGSLSSNISVQNNIISMVETQKVFFSLNKSKVPQGWETEWEISANEGITVCKEVERGQFVDILECEALKAGSMVIINAYNEHAPKEVSNSFIFAANTAKEGDFFSCVNAPENHTPSTCIDIFKNGQWDRNGRFSCLNGFVKEGKTCRKKTNGDLDFEDICSTYGYYGIDNMYHVELRDKSTNQASEKCRADDWEVKVSSGTFGTPSQNQEFVKFYRGTGGNVNVRAIRSGEYTADNYLQIEKANSPTTNVSNQNPIIKISANGRTNITLTPGQKTTINMEVSDTDKVLENNSYGTDFQLSKQGVLSCTSNIKSLYNSQDCVANQTGRTEATIKVTVYKGSEIIEIKSNTIIINVVGQTTSNPSPTPAPTQTKVQIPKAGYEDKVRTNYTNEENPFFDTDIRSEKGIAAAELFRRGIIGGFADGSFKMDQLVNRAEAAKFLMLARKVSGQNSSTTNKQFWDAIEGEWYYEYITDAANAGIINGYSDGSFRPANTIIRSEFLKMITLSFEMETGLSYSYADESEYPGAWFWDYAGAGQKYDLFPNLGNRLNPTQEITRGEVALAIYQYLKNREESINNTTNSSNNSSTVDNNQNSVTATTFTTREFTQEDFNYSLLYPEPYFVSYNKQQPTSNLLPEVKHTMRLNKTGQPTYIHFDIGVYEKGSYTTDGTTRIRDISINGTLMEERSGDQPLCNENECVNFKVYTFEKDNLIYVLKHDLKSENQSAYDIILNSINFNTSQKNSQNFLSHKNTKYDYTLKYPDTYEITSDRQQPDFNLSGGVLHSLSIKNKTKKYSAASFGIGVMDGETYSTSHLKYIGKRNINGTEMEEYLEDNGECEYANCLLSRKYFIFSKNGNHYMISHDLAPEYTQDYNVMIDTLFF